MVLSVDVHHAMLLLTKSFSEYIAQYVIIVDFQKRSQENKGSLCRLHQVFFLFHTSFSFYIVMRSLLHNKNKKTMGTCLSCCMWSPLLFSCVPFTFQVGTQINTWLLDLIAPNLIWMKGYIHTHMQTWKHKSAHSYILTHIHHIHWLSPDVTTSWHQLL